MVRVVHRWVPTRRLVLVAGTLWVTTYAAIPFLAATRPLATIVTRLRLAARLFTPVVPRRPGQRGRSRVRGTRLRSRDARSTDPSPVWTPLVVPLWYGAINRTIEIVSETACWYHPGWPPIPLRSRPHPRSCGALSHPGSPVHRSRRDARPDRRLVCLEVADGVYVSRGA